MDALTIPEGSTHIDNELGILRNMAEMIARLVPLGGAIRVA